ADAVSSGTSRGAASGTRRRRSRLFFGPLIFVEFGACEGSMPEVVYLVTTTQSSHDTRYAASARNARAPRLSDHRTRGNRGVQEARRICRRQRIGAGDSRSRAAPFLASERLRVLHRHAHEGHAGARREHRAHRRCEQLASCAVLYRSRARRTRVDGCSDERPGWPRERRGLSRRAAVLRRQGDRRSHARGTRDQWLESPRRGISYGAGHLPALDMKRRTVLETIAAAGASALFAPLLAAAAERSAHDVTPVFTQELPTLTLDGWKMTAVEVSYAPGQGSPAHKHPGFV